MKSYTDDQFAELPPRIAAEPGGLDKQKTQLQEEVRAGIEAGEAAQAAQAEGEDLRQNLAALEQLGREATEALRATERAVFFEATQNADYAHDGGRDQVTRCKGRASYFVEVIEFARRCVLPLHELKQRELDAALLAARCSVANERALLSAIERAIACQPLLDAEGVVEFGSDIGSKTNALIAEARDAFLAACQGAEAVTNERSRQMSLGIGIGYGGVK